jgi:hypothetical protein
LALGREKEDNECLSELLLAGPGDNGDRVLGSDVVLAWYVDDNDLAARRGGIGLVDDPGVGLPSWTLVSTARAFGSLLLRFASTSSAKPGRTPEPGAEARARTSRA